MRSIGRADLVPFGGKKLGQQFQVVELVEYAGAQQEKVVGVLQYA